MLTATWCGAHPPPRDESEEAGARPSCCVTSWLLTGRAEIDLIEVDDRIGCEHEHRDGDVVARVERRLLEGHLQMPLRTDRHTRSPRRSGRRPACSSAAVAVVRHRRTRRSCGVETGGGRAGKQPESSQNVSRRIGPERERLERFLLPANGRSTNSVPITRGRGRVLCVARAGPVRRRAAGRERME